MTNCIFLHYNELVGRGTSQVFHEHLNYTSGYFPTILMILIVQINEGEYQPYQYAKQTAKATSTINGV